MKKIGFTLVEVLMTLGIIGVVGMLVTPSLMQNGRNETNAARLSTAVSNFENALATGMAADGAEDLYHWRDVWCDDAGNNLAANVFYAQLTRFMTLNGHEERNQLNAFYGVDPEDEETADLSPMNMTAQGAKGNVPFNMDHVYTALRAKNGALIYIVDKANAPRAGAAGAAGEDDEATARAAGRTLYNKAADIIIDVNGEAGPNIVGRDIFAFMLSHEGVLYPYGSQEVRAYDNSQPLWDTNAGCQDGAITDSTSCTARVVENGYRIDY